MRRNKARKSVGILAFIFWPNYLLWHETLNYLNSLKATFIDPNIAAVYFGAATLTWLLIFAQTIKAVRTEIDATGAIRLPLFFAIRPGGNSLLRAFIILAATFMTGSCADSILSLVAISCALATFYRHELEPRFAIGFQIVGRWRENGTRRCRSRRSGSIYSPSLVSGSIFIADSRTCARYFPLSAWDLLSLCAVEPDLLN